MSQYGGSGKINMSGDDYLELMAFPPGFEKALYKAELVFYGHTFNGLMMIKAFENESYKVAFISEVGMNFFDFELRKITSDNKLNLYINNIYSALDRQVFINSLEKYFSMLLSPGINNKENKTYLKKDGSMIMIKVKSYKGKDAYMSKNLIEPYTEITNLRGITGRERITISLSPKKINLSPEFILIEQAGLDVSFKLELIN